MRAVSAVGWLAGGARTDVWVYVILGACLVYAGAMLRFGVNPADWTEAMPTEHVDVIVGAGAMPGEHIDVMVGAGAIPGEPPPELWANYTSLLVTRRRCLESTGYLLKNHTHAKPVFSLLTTVQRVTTGPTGLQALCDLVVGSRPGLMERRGVEKHTAWVDLDVEELHFVFVQVELIDDFMDKMLPCLAGPLVLIFGDHDATFPRQVDPRFKSPSISAGHWRQLLTDERVSHVWATHLDSREGSGRVSSLPVGLNPGEFPPDWNADRILASMHEPPSDIMGRPLVALDCDRQRRVHPERARVLGMCTGEWRGFCRRETMAKDAFVAGIKRYPFILAVHGGGIDSNPKAWMAIASGVIPIVERFAGDSIYDGLPVAFVDSWSNESLSVERMLEWRSSLSVHFDDPAAWAKVRERLSTEHWWGLIRASLGDAATAHTPRPRWESAR